MQIRYFHGKWSVPKLWSHFMLYPAVGYMTSNGFLKMKIYSKQTSDTKGYVILKMSAKSWYLKEVQTLGL